MLLESIRKNTRSFAGLIIVFFMAMLMAGFGVDYFNAPKQDSTAVTIDDIQIPYAEYQRTYEMYNRMIRNADFAKQQALDSVIRETVLKRFSDEMGLTASLPQVEKKIVSTPSFGGTFDRARYRSYLQQLGMSSSKLEELMRQDIVREQLDNLSKDLSLVSDAELKGIYDFENSKYVFRFAKLTSESFRPKVDTNDTNKLRVYFENNQEKYRKGASVSYSYVPFEWNAFEGKVKITEDDLKAAYEEDDNELMNPRELHLRKFTFAKPKKDSANPLPIPGLEEVTKNSAQSTADSEESVRARAEAIRKRLKDGEAFAKLAEEFQTAGKSGERLEDLGWLTEKAVESSLQPDAQKLDVGEVSKVVEVGENLVVLYLEDQKDETKKPFDTVRPFLETELRKNLSPDYAMAEGETFYQKWTSGAQKPLTDFAKEAGVEPKSSNGLLEESTNPPGVTGLTAEAIKYSAGEKNLIDLPQGAYAVEITEKKDSYIPEFDAVINEVREDYRRSEARNLARADAEKFLALLSSKSFKELSEERGLTPSETEAVTRNSAAGEIFSSQESRSILFNLTKDKKVPQKPLEVGDTFYVAELVRAEPADHAGFATEKSKLLEAEESKSGTRIFTILLSRLRDEANVKPSPSLERASDAI